MTVEKQKIEHIEISKLALWTENPRDPLPEDCRDNLSIIKHALSDEAHKWKLRELSEKMGAYYDYSEIPTVVWEKGYPIVYDGNRRVVLAKLKQGDIRLDPQSSFRLPEVENTIPCCVCPREIALQNVFRKHSTNGSWGIIERDYFLHKFMHEEASFFLRLDLATEGMISRSKDLNQRFIKDELLTEKKLEALGLKLKESHLTSQHSPEDTVLILKGIQKAAADKVLSTRGNLRGDLFNSLEPSIQKIVEQDKGQSYKSLSVILYDQDLTPPRKRRTRYVKVQTDYPLFGGNLYLKSGDVSNAYRDICKLDEFYRKNEKTLSPSFPVLIRMALRLLVELMAKGRSSKSIGDYIQTNITKITLDQDEKTYMSNNGADSKLLIQHLETGGHNYPGNANYAQTKAISLPIGKLLQLDFDVNNVQNH